MVNPNIELPSSCLWGGQSLMRMLVNALEHSVSWAMPSCQLLLSSPMDQGLMLFHSRPPLQQLLLFSLCLHGYPSPSSLNTTTVTITTPDINKMHQDLFFHFVPLTTHCACLIGSSRLFSLSCHSWTNGVSVTPARCLDVAVTRSPSSVSLSRLTAYWALQTAGSARKRKLTKVLCPHAWKRLENWNNFTNSNSSIRGRRLFFFYFIIESFKILSAKEKCTIC